MKKYQHREILLYKNFIPNYKILIRLFLDFPTGQAMTDALLNRELSALSELFYACICCVKVSYCRKIWIDQCHVYQGLLS